VVNGETPEQLVKRLTEAKARAVSETYPDALIIGSDQVAVLDNQILGKPGDHASAVEQLSNASGKKVLFLTGLCLLNVETNNAQINVDKFSVEFRQLSKSQIENYLQREKPYDCNPKGWVSVYLKKWKAMTLMHWSVFP